MSLLPNTISLIEGASSTVGIIAILAILFAESGFFVGLILPGDTLLFAAGFLLSQHYLHINIYLFYVLMMLAAILGSNLGYYLGRKFGPKVFAREDSVFLHKENITRAKKFYKRHGGKTIFLSRFIPTVRTFAPLIAGIGGMTYRRFMFFNVLGGVFWVALITTLGYFLGARFKGSIDHYVLPIVAIVIISSWIPAIIHFSRDATGRRLLFEKLRTIKVIPGRKQS
ncbi:MAG TPA: VTT domain-containing protein [Candidatus Saccharimonadales bacterium]|nr:VTT domain-containing protein [Candidatus Saccharimonadales bacterium]